MINGFVSKNKELVKYIIIGLIGLIILLDFIALFGSFSNNAGSNAGVFFYFIVKVALLGLLVVCILTEKHDYAKFLGIAYLTYYVISMLLSIDVPFYEFYDGNSGAGITAGVFEMIAMFTYLGVVVMLVLEALGKHKFGMELDIVIFAFLGLMFLTMIVKMAAYGKANYGWASYMRLFSRYLFMPALACLGYFYLTAKEEVVEIKDEPLESFDAEPKGKKKK